MYLRDRGVSFCLENTDKENADCCAIRVLDGIVGREIALAQNIRLAAVRLAPFEYGVVNRSCGKLRPNGAGSVRFLHIGCYANVAHEYGRHAANQILDMVNHFVAAIEFGLPGEKLVVDDVELIAIAFQYVPSDIFRRVQLTLRLIVRVVGHLA